MNLSRVVTKTSTYALCPCCGGDVGSIDHLTYGQYSWYCDGCGNQIAFVLENGQVLSAKSTGDKKIKTLDFLSNGKVGLIVEGMAFVDKSGKCDLDSKEYWYNEHTCPTNYTQNILAVVDLSNGDCDPHGIFEYAGSVGWVEGADTDCNFDFSNYLGVFK